MTQLSSVRCFTAPCRRRVAARPPLGHSSRRLLGASFATLSHKWEPRFSGGPSAAGTPSEDWEAAAVASGVSDLQALLLPPSLSAAAASPRPARRSASLQRGGSAGSGLSSGSEGAGLGPAKGSASRSASVDRQLDKWGSQEFADESPFWPAAAATPAMVGTGANAGPTACSLVHGAAHQLPCALHTRCCSLRAATATPCNPCCLAVKARRPMHTQLQSAPRLAGAKSAPLMHTIVEVCTSSEVS